IQAHLSGWARGNRSERSALRLQLAAYLQNVAEDTEGIADARRVSLRQFCEQQVQPRSKQVGLLRRPELGGNGNSQHGFPGGSLINLRSTVGAVYDRPQCRNRDIAGGHRPPLQLFSSALNICEYLDSNSIRFPVPGWRKLRYSP